MFFQILKVEAVAEEQNLLWCTTLYLLMPIDVSFLEN